MPLRRGSLKSALLQVAVQAGLWFRSLWGGAVRLMLVACLPLQAQDGQAQDVGQGAASANDPTWDFHFQSTLIGQGVLPFAAEYSGASSLEPHGEVKDTFSFDITARVRLWRGGEFFADFLSWQGYGLSKTLGVAGFPNGEAYRLGKTFPDAVVARAYLRRNSIARRQSRPQDGRGRHAAVGSCRGPRRRSR